MFFGCTSRISLTRSLCLEPMLKILGVYVKNTGSWKKDILFQNLQLRNFALVDASFDPSGAIQSFLFVGR
jgi:hypothetical protein